MSASDGCIHCSGGAGDHGTRRATIRALNDAFRKSFVGGVVMITKAVVDLPPEDCADLLDAVRDYDLFEYENDPHGEHDLGILDTGAGRFLWKIDYYDRELRFGSPDPAEPGVTTRVLTIMKAEE